MKKIQKTHRNRPNQKAKARASKRALRKEKERIKAEQVLKKLQEFMEPKNDK